MRVKRCGNRIRPAGIGPLARSSPRHDRRPPWGAPPWRGDPWLPAPDHRVVAKVVSGHRAGADASPRGENLAGIPGPLPDAAANRPWSCRRVDVSVASSTEPRTAHGAAAGSERGSPSGSRPDTIFAFFSMRSKMPQPIAADTGADDGVEAGDRLRRDGVQQSPSLGVAFAHRERGPAVTDSTAGRSRLEGWRS